MASAHIKLFIITKVEYNEVIICRSNSMSQKLGFQTSPNPPCIASSLVFLLLLEVYDIKESKYHEKVT